MGYNTDYTGRFKLNKVLDVETKTEIENIDASKLRYPPSQYMCDWVPTHDGKGLEWNGSEKSYDMVEWLQYICNNILAPKGYKLSGEVEWQGEESHDMGKIIVENNNITTKRAKISY